MSLAGKTAFAVGTGRCGTYLLYQLMQCDPGVAASHERNVLAECFHRYCVWYGLPVDDAAFVATKRREIEADLTRCSFSFEASAPLSFSIRTLHHAFGARFVLLVRNPVDVVNSYLSKHWFDQEIYWDDSALAPGYQPCHEHPHHALGRLMPMGPEYDVWQRMGRVGKLAWTWSTVNRAVLTAFRSLPEGDSLILRLEDFDFLAYKRLLAFLGRAAVIDESAFTKLTRSRPNSRSNKPSVESWTAKDVSEFLTHAGQTAVQFGYEVDLSGARGVAGDSLLVERSDPCLVRLRRGLRGAVAAFREGIQSSTD